MDSATAVKKLVDDAQSNEKSDSSDDTDIIVADQDLCKCKGSATRILFGIIVGILLLLAIAASTLTVTLYVRLASCENELENIKQRLGSAFSVSGT
jgi:hypothetical protein